MSHSHTVQMSPARRSIDLIGSNREIYGTLPHKHVYVLELGLLIGWTRHLLYNVHAICEIRK